MHYFAYGSNMNHMQMSKRCPGSKFIKRAFLEDHKFIYDGYSFNRMGAVANVIERKKSIVWGGLFKLNYNDLVILDRYEGYPRSYNKKTVKVKDDTNNIIKVIIYYRISKGTGEPSDNYRNAVILGAKDCKIPNKYIEDNLQANGSYSVKILQPKT